ncbi:ABC transporter substrate-binding protein [Ottowia caeni]|uniref:ABC transporter substrate-binding protein n=1 Tax=Ottowia caeni TaxID=2870339 RepID=UPI001E5FF169
MMNDKNASSHHERRQTMRLGLLPRTGAMARRVFRQLVFTAGAALLASAVFAQAPRSGGTLNLIVNPEPPGINLGNSKLGPSSFVGSKIYEGLISLSPKLEPIPRLAQSWTISPDGKVYTFKLRPGVKWHDGKPFTSADVLFSFKQYLPATFARTKLIMEQTASIEAPDDLTVVFTLKNPYPAFMYIFEATGGTIMPKHVYEGVTDYRTTSVNNTIVGTGPFKLAEWRRGAFIKLVKNPDYWDKGKPHLDNLFFHIVPDAVGRSIAFESGKVDAIRAGDVENFEIARLAAAPGVSLTKAGWEFLQPVGFLNMNLRNKPIDDLRFRQAIAHAIDRQFIIKNLFSTFGETVNGPFPGGYAFRDTSVETKYSYDPARAKALLDEMGLKPGPDGTRVTLRLLPLPYGETWQRLAEFTRERLGAVGIKTTIVATDVPGWASRISSGDFDLAYNFVYLLGDPAIGVNQTYLSTNQLNRGSAANVDGYVNQEVDALLIKAERETNKTERAKLYSQIQKILSRDLPILWTHQMVMPTVYRTKVNNLISTGLGMNENFADVWIGK